MTQRRTTTPVEAPQPAEVKRFVRVERLQMIGIPIIGAVVIAGLFGAFDDTSARSDSRAAPLALHVEYPSRVQHQQGRPLLIEVRNESAAAVEEVAVEIDRAYIEAFDAGSFLPAPDEITPDAYVVKLGEIQPGDVRRVAADLKAEKVGRQEGQIRVSSGERRLAAIDLSTFVFP